MAVLPVLICVRAFKEIAAPLRLLLILLFTLMLPPYTVIGPLIFIALANVTSAVLVDLPMITLLNVLPNVHPDVENALLKAAAADSMRNAPGPSIEELVEVGALLEITKVPPEIVVVPVYEPLPVRVKVVVPVFVKPPAPLMLPA